MLVEFQRYQEHQDEATGEDDGLETTSTPRVVSVNPATVSAVFASVNHENVTIIRGPDGRGILVKGSYAEVMTKLDHHVDHEQTEV